MHSSREGSPDSQGLIIAAGNPREMRRRQATRAGAGPLESDEEELFNQLGQSNHVPRDDVSDDGMVVDDIDPETGEDNAVRSSASSPPLASYDNRATNNEQNRFAAQVNSDERRINAVINRMQAEEDGSSDSDRADNDDDDISSENAVPGQQIVRSRGPLQHHLE